MDTMDTMDGWAEAELRGRPGVKCGDAGERLARRSGPEIPRAWVVRTSFLVVFPLATRLDLGYTG
jgi:hypothetical protein